MSVLESSTDLRRLIGYDEEEDADNDFEPVPYTFRIPEKWKKAGESTVLSPPHWLLLDHTIAVVWSLFSAYHPGKSLDIEDLKWAHEFLKEVRNGKGDNPPDVKTCLSEIQDRLIALYAQLTHRKGGDKRKEAPQVEEGLPLSRQKTNLIEPAKVTVKESGRELKPEVGKRQQARETGLREPRKTVVTQQRRVTVGSTKTLPVPAKRTEPVRRESVAKKEEETPENFFTEVFNRNKTSDRILNAQPMMRKKTGVASRSNKDASQTDLSQSDDGKIPLPFRKFMTEEESNDKEQAYRNLKNEIESLTRNPKISKGEVHKFLSNWREKQVERLQTELRRLYSIEEIMKSLKVDGFTPYMQGNMILEMESIKDKKNTSEQSL